MEAILANPGLYVSGNARMFLDVVFGRRRDEGLRMHLDEHLQPDVVNRFTGLEYLLGPPTAAQALEEPRSEWLVSIYQPYRYMGLLAALYLIGTVASIARPEGRAALFFILGSPLVLAASVAVVGGVPRYRYPIDPFITLTAAAGAVWAIAALQRARCKGGRG